MVAETTKALDRLQRAFTGGYAQEEPRTNRITGAPYGNRYVFHVEQAGTIRFPSGRIVAIDPLVLMNQTLARKVAPGLHEVDISVSEHSLTGPGRPHANVRRDVAWLRVRFSEEPVVRLEPAMPNDEGIGVDSGCVAILSQELRDAPLIPMHGPPGLMQVPPYTAPLLARVRRKELVSRYPTSGQAELVAVWPGDGVYTAYCGLDARGRAASLVVDVSGLPE